MEMSAQASVAPVEPDETRFDRNMEALASWAPGLHARLANLETVHSELIWHDDGGVDMALHGKPFYGFNAVEHARKQLDWFFENPQRRLITEPQAANLKGLSGEFCFRAVKKMKAAGLKFEPGVVGPSSYFTIIFGVGLGFHIGPMLEFTGCKVLIVVEPNLENLFHSLSVVDWEKIFSEADERGCKIEFVTETQADGIFLSIRSVIRKTSPTFVDGVYLLTHYPASAMSIALQRFHQNLGVLVSGIGYLEDEYRMTANAASNIARRQVYAIDKPLPMNEVPCFVVGSGPSIDSSIDRLRELQDKAIIISIGSGLRGLLANEIKPDFHVEMENPIESVDFVKIAAEEHDLSGVTLIGAMTIHSTLRELFDDTVLFFRERSSATMLFGADHSLIRPSGPTVANSAVSVAVRLGFKEIYMFGVDMGAKHGDYHSRHSVYGDGSFEEVLGAQPRVPVPGNFGGTAYAEGILDWSRQMLENFVRFCPHVDWYNCSDGARINGATPKLPSIVDLVGGPFDKAAWKEEIRRHFPPLREPSHYWDHDKMCVSLDEILTRLRDVVGRNQSSPEVSTDWMDECIDIVRYEVGESSVDLSYLFGSFMMMCGVFHWYDRRILDDDDRDKCRRLMLEQFAVGLDYAEGVLHKLYDDVESVFKGDLDVIWIPPETENLIPLELAGDAVQP